MGFGVFAGVGLRAIGALGSSETVVLEASLGTLAVGQTGTRPIENAWRLRPPF